MRVLHLRHATADEGIMAALVTTGDSESEPLARTVSLEDGRGGALIVRSFGVGRGSQRYQDTGGRPSLVGCITGNADALPFSCGT